MRKNIKYEHKVDVPITISMTDSKETWPIETNMEVNDEFLTKDPKTQVYICNIFLNAFVQQVADLKYINLDQAAVMRGSCGDVYPFVIRVSITFSSNVHEDANVDVDYPSNWNSLDVRHKDMVLASIAHMFKEMAIVIVKKECINESNS